MYQIQYNENMNQWIWLPHNYLVVPTYNGYWRQIASVFNGNYAIAIVIVSILVRVVFDVTQFHQMKTMLVQQKNGGIKNHILLKFARAEQMTPQEKLWQSTEQMELYKQTMSLWAVSDQDV